MYKSIIETITSDDDTVRNRTEEALLSGKSKEELLRMAEGLEFFRKQSDNLYHRVRACLFIHAIYRYYLIDRKDVPKIGLIDYDGIRAVLSRGYDEAIERFRAAMMSQGCNEALLSALAEAYFRLAFKYLVDQVRQSVRTSIGNKWMFAINTLRQYPLKVSAEYTTPDIETGNYSVGADKSPLRADPCHSGWSDIFFLGMDFPEGARVVNMSVDLAVRGFGQPKPPVTCYCRYIKEPVIRLVSLDLNCKTDITSLAEIFNFGIDHLGLLKAGVIASGVIPSSYEGKDIPLGSILKKLLGKRGGFELVTNVPGIPKGSRFAVSTTLLATIITRLMRFSGQIQKQKGGLSEEERRIVASRAILGEWLGGSGGGWQDSGGIWPGIKIIEGVEASKGDPEYGISRGRLLPSHSVLAREQLPPDIEETLRKSIVLVHGGLSMNVGPVLEMVTTRYLLRYRTEWLARQKGHQYFSDIVEAIKEGNMKSLGKLCDADWNNSIKKIIPWASNAFTEKLIAQVKKQFGKKYLGFIMLGGASGGGMGFIVKPEIHSEFCASILKIMRSLKKKYEYALPFAMEPIVYDFNLNYKGIQAKIMKGKFAIIPCKSKTFRLTQSTETDNQGNKRENMNEEMKQIKNAYGFDEKAHSNYKQMLKSGRIGVGNNRLPLTAVVENVSSKDITVVSNDLSNSDIAKFKRTGQELLRKNAVAVVTYSGGLGSRWCEGAAVVKAINPFVVMKRKHRTFVEVHLGKTSEMKHRYEQPVQHVFTTSYLTHEPLRNELEISGNYGYNGHVYLSPGRSIGHRVYPMERDLRFLWEELSQQQLDERAEKVQSDAREALIEWARARGEGEDYMNNAAIQRFNPPGHFFEVPNMFRNGILSQMLKDNPNLEHLMVHNADTLGVFLSPIMIGMHHLGGKTINFEVTPRRYEDKGGGLAKINGRIQLVETLALPREEDEFKLTYYNTLTNWINIDKFLKTLDLSREIIVSAPKDKKSRKKIDKALKRLESQVRTYVTIKNVKLLWGAGQEDIYPVAQFEKLWGDITWLEDFNCGFFAVERRRGQQLKDPAQLDRWVRDGSRDYVAGKARFNDSTND
ncbi:MAG: UTP--glucose-1-phosphate uridylyltransferase [Chlamydiae bacterium]|nr:MAG: UTP--glucose-1-phosphate uridylyltransferase [Chlamydiota bacterium]